MSSLGVGHEALSWRRSTVCAGGNCVEVARTAAGVALRDSKDLDGPILEITSGEWLAFLEGAMQGDFDDLIEPHHHQT